MMMIVTDIYEIQLNNILQDRMQLMDGKRYVAQYLLQTVVVVHEVVHELDILSLVAGWNKQ